MERERRLFVALEAMAVSYGRIEDAARTTGMAQSGREVEEVCSIKDRPGSSKRWDRQFPSLGAVAIDLSVFYGAR